MPPPVRDSVLDAPLLPSPDVCTANGDVLVGGLHKRVPDAARDAVREIERKLPGYVRAHDARYGEMLSFTAEWAIGHFVDLLGDPGLPSAAITDHFREIGAGEAREGRGLEMFQSALRIGAGVAVQRLTEEAESLDGPVTAAAVVRVTQAVLGYLDRLAAAAAEGHADSGALRAGRLQAQRRALLEALIERDAGLARIRFLAADCDWPVPRTVAAVALSESRGDPGPRHALPPDALLGLHLDDPCLIVPDPDGPGRSQALHTTLTGWGASVGPTVPVTLCAVSLRLARRALALARDGFIQAPSPITAADHIPMAMLGRSPQLTSLLIDRKLRPLLSSPRVHARDKLAETFLTCIESNFSPTEVAARMHVHAQTVRYRLRQLEALFGDDLHDPAQRLEFHLALRAWIARN
ncbi:PucR family transcriptional regulator [Actinomadura verrucosospora]|uniref:PucR family transcriptional regulator n=1 Tax=Actinomadura verrucosospora TaxID=46165 RepID=A0A7D3VYY5_ACTVE|nr:helix-turn-helix domain-containing protein [Actinomadura verrucosospora]QKG27073.1 PucR family transcriptional regulator [Actinomadura verrucosospora]